MESSRDDFEPFIEDDEKWDAYIERMSEDGTWAGNMELQAASLVCMANVRPPGWPAAMEIVNFPPTDGFVTYEGSEHRLRAPHLRRRRRPGRPITLARSNGAYATRGDVGGRNPAPRRRATVAEAGGACRKRERERSSDSSADASKSAPPQSRGDVYAASSEAARGTTPSPATSRRQRRARRGSNLRPRREGRGRRGRRRK